MKSKVLQLTEQERQAEREAIKKLAQEQNERWEKIKKETEEIVSELEEDSAK